MKKIISLLIMALFVMLCIQSNTVNAQPPLAALKERFAKAEDENINKPYEGVVTSKGKEKGLFPIKSTGVTTAPIKEAGEAFLNSLTKEQLAKTQFEIDNKEWQKWANMDNGLYKRQGISIKEMSQEQRSLAFGLMQKSLSAKGLQLSKDIMKTDQTLRELNSNDSIYDEQLYFFTVMGKPSATEPWGWQIDGHHLVINYFILGDQVVMTPTFMGGEPIVTTTGKYAGNTIFQDEQNIGLKFMQSLTAQQQKQATLSQNKGRNDIAAEAFFDNKMLDYQGLPATKMTAKQKEQLLNLANQYISNMEEGHAKIEMKDIKKHLSNTWFAWIGKADSGAVFYYRIHSPVILIEFDHQAPVGIRGPGRDASRNHIHTIVRTPNGNDYGKDLLKEHLEKYHSYKSSSPAAVDSSKAAEIEKVVSLANAFKALLSDIQLKTLQLGWTKEDAAKWSNFPQAFSHPQRVGISFSQLTNTQIQAAKALMAYVLDNKTINEGFDETEGILAADNLIGSLPGKSGTFGTGNYYIAFLGEPSTTALWELQFGGHHLAFSNTYKDGKLIGMTPSFRGAEPMTPIEANGKHYQPMEQERLAFKNMLDMFSEDELTAAKLSATFSDILLGPGKDNAFPSAKQGLKVGTLSKEKKDLVLKAISLYVKDINATEADKILATYTKEIDDTYIAFAGSKTFDKVGDYFRIDGPGVWIEYNTQPSRDIPPTHPHSIWRDRRSDYGGN